MLKKGEAIPAGDMLVGLTGSSLTTADGSARLVFPSELARLRR